MSTDWIAQKKMDVFLETKTTKPNHEELENLRRSIMNKETESVKKTKTTSKQRKAQGPIAFQMNSIKYLKN